MYLDVVLGKIDLIQLKHENERNLKPIGQVFEPGTTGFKPKKGMILVHPIEVPRRKNVILTTEKTKASIADYKGIYPFIGLVIESNSELCAPKDVIAVDMQTFTRAKDIVIDGTLGLLIYESDVLGVETNLMQ